MINANNENSAGDDSIPEHCPESDVDMFDEGNDDDGPDRPTKRETEEDLEESKDMAKRRRTANVAKRRFIYKVANKARKISHEDCIVGKLR